ARRAVRRSSALHAVGPPAADRPRRLAERSRPCRDRTAAAGSRHTPVRRGGRARQRRVVQPGRARGGGRAAAGGRAPGKVRALALGFDGPPLDLAFALQRAEQAATGVPCGLMDQLVITGAVAGHALLIDCGSLETTPVPVPDEVDVVVAHSGQRRELGLSAYAE